MNAYNVIDAFSQSFFALLAIWAAVDRRHWFVRFVLVSGILLASLLIPAYEVVIEFGLQMALIMAGIWLAQGRREWPPRLSLETALLSMVVVAVAAAVIAHIPNIQPGVWASLLNAGVSTACFGLLALWIVFGKTRLRTRLLLALPGLALTIAIFHFGSAVVHMMWRTSGSLNWSVLREAYSWERIASWLTRTLPTIALAAPVMLSVLWLARESRWFGATPAQTSNASALPKRVVAARAGLCAMLLTIVSPLIMMFYLLMTPPSLDSSEALPSPNGFDDFIAAGNMIPPTLPNVFQISFNKPAIEQLFRDLQPAADRVALGLQKTCLVPLDDAESWGGVNFLASQAVDRAAYALFLRAEYYRVYGSSEQEITALITLLKLEQEGSRGAVHMMETIGRWHDTAIQRLRSAIYRLSADQLRGLAAELCKLEASREPFEVRAARQLIYDLNSEWTRRAAIILDDWSGKRQYEAHRDIEKRRTVQRRLLLADLASQAFWLEYRRPADSWEELVPAYLPVVPQDAYVEAPLKYRREGLRYVIYSARLEDVENLIRTQGFRDDQAVIGPYHPPLWTQLRAAATDGLEKLQRYINRDAEPKAPR